MSGKMRFTAVFLVSLIGSVFVHAADNPSIHQIYAAAEAGRFVEAQRMMDQVLKDHPDSAKAHFVEAELLAKQGRIADANGELRRAEALAPGLPFAKPESVQHLKQLLAGGGVGVVSYAAPVAPARGISWSGVLLGGGVIAMLIFGLRRLFARRAAPAVYAPSATGPTYGGTPMGQVPPQGGGGLGSSIVGGLATGAAVGAGMVAGEAIAHHFLDGDERRRADNTLPNGEDRLANDDMGGSDFGISDNSAWDDNSFGGGGDSDW